MKPNKKAGWEEKFLNQFSFVTWGGEEWRGDRRPEDAVKFIRKTIAQELRGLMEEAIAIFEKLPEDEMMTKNPVILELKVLKESIGGEDER